LRRDSWMQHVVLKHDGSSITYSAALETQLQQSLTLMTIQIHYPFINTGTGPHALRNAALTSIGDFHSHILCKAVREHT